MHDEHLVIGLAELAPLDQDVHGIPPAEGMRGGIPAGALGDLQAAALLHLQARMTAFRSTSKAAGACASGVEALVTQKFRVWHGQQMSPACSSN